MAWRGRARRVSATRNAALKVSPAPLESRGWSVCRSTRMAGSQMDCPAHSSASMPVRRASRPSEWASEVARWAPCFPGDEDHSGALGDEGARPLLDPRPVESGVDSGQAGGDVVPRGAEDVGVGEHSREEEVPVDRPQGRVARQVGQVEGGGPLLGVGALEEVHDGPSGVGAHRRAQGGVAEVQDRAGLQSPLAAVFVVRAGVVPEGAVLPGDAYDDRVRGGGGGVDDELDVPGVGVLQVPPADEAEVVVADHAGEEDFGAELPDGARAVRDGAPHAHLDGPHFGELAGDDDLVGAQLGCQVDADVPCDLDRDHGVPPGSRFMFDCRA